MEYFNTGHTSVVQLTGARWFDLYILIRSSFATGFIRGDFAEDVQWCPTFAYGVHGGVGCN